MCKGMFSKSSQYKMFIKGQELDQETVKLGFLDFLMKNTSTIFLQESMIDRMSD